MTEYVRKTSIFRPYHEFMPISHICPSASCCLSTDGTPIQCQHESPVWDAVKLETVFSANSSTVIQHGLGTALGPGGPGPRPLSVLLCSMMAVSALLRQDIFRVSDLAREMQSSVLSHRGRGELVHRHTSGPWLVLLHANENSKSPQFDWSKGTVLIGQSHSDW